MSTTLGTIVTGLLRPERDARLVTDGRVSCPRSSVDVDVDWCLTCPSLQATFDGKAGTWIRCRGTGDPRD